MPKLAGVTWTRPEGGLFVWVTLPAGFEWIWFLVKVFALLFFYIWMRWTLPRYRYDQLMSFGWKWLFPASVINLLVTAALVLYFNA